MKFKPKHILSIIIFFATSLLFVLVAVKSLQLFKKFQKDQSISTETRKLEKPSAFEKLSLPIYTEPEKIYFETQDNLEIGLNIEEIGLDEGGYLGVPIEWGNAGWYTKSAKPGEKGNMIIDGHYDTSAGSPAAFWELKNLKEGDKVVIHDKLGKLYEYRVVSKYFIGINDPDRTKIFDDTEEKELTLVTCGGVWDFSKATYNQRLVVKAILK